MGSAFSEDGKTYAYSLSSGGSDWRTVKFMSVDQVCTSKAATLRDIRNLKDRGGPGTFAGMIWQSIEADGFA